MTTPSSDSPLLNQILATLTTLGERLAVVEADLKTVIRDHTKDLDDHEIRLRALEGARSTVMTREDFEEYEKDRTAAADRSQNKRLTYFGLIFAAAQVVEGAYLYWLSVKG